MCIHVQWAYTELLGGDFILRLEGMLILISCVGVVGLEELMKVGFGGVLKILARKSFPQNTRSFRIAAEEILHEILGKSKRV